MPCAGAVTALTSSASPSTSESFARTSSAAGTSSETVAASLAASGGSFTGVTPIEIVAGADTRLPSLARKVNESGPLKLGAGV